ncbi:MAG: extracellular solute-binding protein [Pseudonocardiaceae bacterium]
MKTRRGTLPLPLLAALAVAALVAAGCGATTSAADSGSGSGETITLYNAQHQQTTDALIAAFTAQTGIKVTVRSDSEDVLTAQIEQEGAKSPADVFYTENSPWLEQLDRKHLLAKVDSATLRQVPAADSDASGDWVGVSARVSALIYNTDDLTASQLPKSVLDLADPRWKGKLDLAPSETDFWPIVSSVARTYGQAKALAWLRALKANAGSNANTPSNETVTSDVSQGSSQLAVINGYYYYRLRAEVGTSAVHAALAYFAPHDPGYALNISGAAVLTSSKHQAAAQKLIAFLTSTTGQTILAHSDSFEYPIGAHVAANPALTPFDQLQPNAFSVTELGTGEDAKTLLQQAQLL